MIIAGAGACGSEVLWLLEESDFQWGKYQVLGFVDDTPERQGTAVNGYPVLGTIDWLNQATEDVCVVIGVGSSEGRYQIYQKLKDNPYISFPTVLASNVKCADGISYGEGCIFCYSGLLMPNCKIGNFVYMNIRSFVGHDAVVGDFCTINPSVSISGNVKIGQGSEIGVGASIIEKKTVGEYVTLGAGATVIRDIPSCTVAVGVPAQVVKIKAAVTVSE